MTKGFENFIPLVAAAHEMAASAAALADEAREIEKGNDSVLRTPHMKEGNTGCTNRSNQANQNKYKIKSSFLATYIIFFSTSKKINSL